MATLTLPSLTLPDPMVSGEGALDPLGLANLADKLAEELVPGVRARQNRIRYVTAIAVAACIVDGLDDQIAVDGNSTPRLIFEWLLVEGLVRASDYESYRGTAGNFKVRDAIDRKVAMSAKNYLKTPTVFGFHGVYKTLAEDLELVDRDMRLRENGHHLVDVWEREQGLSGFLDRAVPLTGRSGWKESIRGTVERSLKLGYSDASPSWAGWQFFANHLNPSGMGAREAEVLHGLLTRREGGSRREVFQRIAGTPDLNQTDDQIATQVIYPAASPELRQRVDAIAAYEHFCSTLEVGFSWMQFMARDAKAPLSVDGFAANASVADLASALPVRLAKADRAIEGLSLELQKEFHEVTMPFTGVRTAPDLFRSILHRHTMVQGRKPPSGKREWFERPTSEQAIVRAPYRQAHEPEEVTGWGRPYRLMACRRFASDLQRAHGRA